MLRGILRLRARSESLAQVKLVFTTKDTKRTKDCIFAEPPRHKDTKFFLKILGISVPCQFLRIPFPVLRVLRDLRG